MTTKGQDNMVFYHLSGRDRQWLNWILFKTIPYDLMLRPRYAPFQCRRCGSVDAFAALEAGLDSDVRLAGNHDIARTDDGFCCVKNSVRQALLDCQVKGVEFLPLPGDPRYSLLLPRLVVPARIVPGEVTITRQCPDCRRMKVTGLPAPESMSPPQEPFAIFTIELEMHQWSTGCMFWATEPVVEILRRHRFTGVHYWEISSPQPDTDTPAKSG